MTAMSAMRNHERTTVAAERTVAQARTALRHMDTHLPCTEIEIWSHILYRPVLEIRVQRPAATLRELGAALSLTKDTYSARLRRALRFTQPKEH
ncbi:hypothetical protein B5566_02690 [Mycobacterium sp. MHSD3]|nr:hypothetical protein B5566_02690 [Mycobacterium sp. MHSD3]